MKERPILFSAPMVRALLDGTKTQTRRLLKPWNPPISISNKPMPADVEYLPDFTCYRSTCPYGQPGDRLWVKETHSFVPDHDEPAGYSAVLFKADDDAPRGKWRPSIHMPRAASRILLEVVSVRVERLSAISEADARAEGIESLRGEGVYWRDYSDPEGKNTVSLTARGPIDSYRTLWEAINGAGSWDANPWVWCVEFRRVAP